MRTHAQNDVDAAHDTDGRTVLHPESITVHGIDHVRIYADQIQPHELHYILEQLQEFVRLVLHLQLGEHIIQLDNHCNQLLLIGCPYRHLCPIWIRPSTPHVILQMGQDQKNHSIVPHPYRLHQPIHYHPHEPLPFKEALYGILGLLDPLGTPGLGDAVE